MQIHQRILVIGLTLFGAACAQLPIAHNIERQHQGANAVAGSLVTVEELARAPDLFELKLSPSGRELATIETVDGRGEIRVRDLSSGTVKSIYRDPARSLSNVKWSADGRWLLFLQDAGGDEGYHLYRLDPQHPGLPPVDLTPFAGIEANIVGLPVRNPGTALVSVNRRDPQYPDVFAIDLALGTAQEIFRNDRSFTDFWGDAEGELIAAQSITDRGEIEVWARIDPHAAWKIVYRAPANEHFTFQEIAPDGQSAIVKTNRDNATDRLTFLDLHSGKLAKISSPACGRFDEGKMFLSPSGEPVLLACTMERATLIPFEPVTAADLAAARRLVGDEAAIELESASSDFRTMILYSDRSDRPGEFVLVDHGKASHFAALRPWLEGRDFRPSEAVWIPARDGLPLLSYLTRPASQVHAAPLVVSVHGGPWSRDSGGFEPSTQMLASRGYAVLQVNFRGSTGLGKAHAEAAIGEFGAAMSDDIVDAARWAIDQGIADKDKMCVMGGSYGGYAALVAMTRDSGLFACGIDFAGPADLVTLMEAFPPSWQPYLPRSWYRFVGDPSKPEERARMIDRSPLHHIGLLSAPMLIFQGANDPRVTQPQSDAVVCALRSRGIVVDYLLAGSEGHSFGNEETSLAVNRAVEEFLARQLGGPIVPAAEKRTHDALGELRKAGAAISCPSKPN